MSNGNKTPNTRLHNIRHLIDQKYYMKNPQIGKTYNGLPAKDVGIETDEFSTDVQSSLNKNVFL